MKRIYYIVLCLWGIVTLVNCKQTFEPSLPGTETGYLVVEGIINSGNEVTVITLSRTVPLDKKQVLKAEGGAILTVESSTGVFYNFVESKPGTYTGGPYNLPATATYRLNIKTTNGKTYQSAFVTVKHTPPIDNIEWERTTNGLTLNVSAHDPANNTRYYRWDFEETWRYNADVQSIFESTGTKIILRTTPIYTCYKTTTSTNILLTSTVKLTDDVVSKFVLTSIPNRSEKISDKYSINVKQYALTKEGYEFWENQRKNTEQLGTIFDAQPSELAGNIRCLQNAEEPVVGFVSVSTEAQKRIFLTYNEVNWGPMPFSSCVLDTIAEKNPGDIAFFLHFPPGGTPRKIPVRMVDPDQIHPAPSPGDPPVYLAVDPPCADCRLKGGTTTVPSFWQ